MPPCGSVGRRESLAIDSPARDSGRLASNGCARLVLRCVVAAAKGLCFAPFQLAAQNLEVGFLWRIDKFQRFFRAGDADKVRRLQRDPVATYGLGVPESFITMEDESRITNGRSLKVCGQMGVITKDSTAG